MCTLSKLLQTIKSAILSNPCSTTMVNTAHEGQLTGFAAWE